MFRALVIITTAGLLAGCNTFTPRETTTPSKIELKSRARGHSFLHDRDLARGGGGNTKDDGGYGNGGTGDGGGKLQAPD